MNHSLKVGLALNMPAETGKSDAEIVREHFALGDMAESLGFDSLFALEHHFSDYLISPSPLQTLTYFAGRTKRISLGTAVVVLPWHHPIQIAEQISMLDILCDGRCLFAFGRGRPTSEYQGFGVDFSESGSMFSECVEIVRKALASKELEFHGRHYRIPALTVRPRPISSPERRLYAAVSSEHSVRSAAEGGLGLLLATTKPWRAMQEAVLRYSQIAQESGQATKSPIVLASLYVSKSRSHAEESALKYFEREDSLASVHYRPPNIATAKESGSIVKSTDMARDHRLQDYMRQQIVGTSDDCVEQIQELVRMTGTEHLLVEISYGGMPFDEAKANLLTLSEHVLGKVRAG